MVFAMVFALSSFASLGGVLCAFGPSSLRVRRSAFLSPVRREDGERLRGCVDLLLFFQLLLLCRGRTPPVVG